VIVGAYTSLASVLLLAFIFGYAQQTVTRFIDRKAVASSRRRTRSARFCLASARQRCCPCIHEGTWQSERRPQEGPLVSD
jgi:hypothetical protein